MNTVFKNGEKNIYVYIYDEIVYIYEKIKELEDRILSLTRPIIFGDLDCIIFRQKSLILDQYMLL